MTERAICGDCPRCRPLTLRLLRAGKRGRTLLPGDKPTAAALEKHATRFGPEQVAETAAEYGVSIAITRPKATRRVSGPSLKARVAGYVKDGYSVEVIAELEDLSPSRARRLVAEVKEAA